MLFYICGSQTWLRDVMVDLRSLIHSLQRKVVPILLDHQLPHELAIVGLEKKNQTLDIQPGCMCAEGQNRRHGYVTDWVIHVRLH